MISAHPLPLTPLRLVFLRLFGCRGGGGGEQIVATAISPGSVFVMVTLHPRFLFDQPALKGRDWPIDQHTSSGDHDARIMRLLRSHRPCRFYFWIERSSLLPTRSRVKSRWCWWNVLLLVWALRKLNQP